ncbi:tRNA (N(6)-L-threonylcarbamoyladenosine(37)-C(2))-methylthiotransferase MtaB [Marinilabiliaceae bacterium ANBcel2]|nr:tRNA (N(6)-L-threonylcarbamoyladenosine(37)-C(2))-methylthiotransferase MtaB [Marinilabiliaceae bacterium ANBcel2]
MIDKTRFQNRTVAFYTLGCKLNFSETSTMARSIENAGFKRIPFGQKAGIYVINTCSVTGTAEKKCRRVIKKALLTNPEAFVVVTGCFAQLKPHAILEIEGVDLVLGSNEKFDIAQYLSTTEKKQNGRVHVAKINKVDQFRPSFSSGDRTRTFLKVQDGCDYYCSYCTIPFARGKSRNATITESVNSAREAALKGAKEIILTGVNIGDFGKSTGDSFLDLLKALDDVEEVQRFRISSVEPDLLSEDIIRFVASSKRFMPHFHIPLQAGSDNVLKLMRRKYDTHLFKKRIDTIRKLLPDAFIGVDVIAGVRGETLKDFQDSVRLLENSEVSELHVFTYSERPGTKALEIKDNVPHIERKRRSDILHQLSDKKKELFYNMFKGAVAKVLFEGHSSDGMITGYTPNYLKVAHSYCEEFANNIVPIKLGECNRDNYFYGEVAHSK